MTERRNIVYDEFDQEQPQQDGPKALRDALDKANKAIAEREKKLDEALKRIESFERKEKASTLGQLFQDKGVDPKYARWADKDGIEPTEDAVAAWIEENKDLLPAAQSNEDSQRNEPGNQGPQGQQADPFAGLPEEVRAALAAMQGSQELESEAMTGIPFDPRAEEAVEASLSAVASNAKSEADIVAALKAMGAPLVNVQR